MPSATTSPISASSRSRRRSKAHPIYPTEDIGTGWYINAAYEHPDVAADLLNFMFFRDESRKKMLESGDDVPVGELNLESVELPQLVQEVFALTNEYRDNGTIHAFLDTVTPASMTDVSYDGLQALLAGQMSPEEFTAAVQAAWEEAKAKNEQLQPGRGDLRVRRARSRLAGRRLDGQWSQSLNRASNRCQRTRTCSVRSAQPFCRQAVWPSGRRGSGCAAIVLQRYLVAYLFILPVLLLYVVFVLRPTLQTFWLAFYKWNGISIDREWVGLANFQRLLGDPIFWQALQHSLIWTAVVVTFNLVVGLIAAALLAGSIRGRLLFQLGYFLPVVQASVVTAMIWRWIYAPTGVLNTVWRPSAGIPRPGLARRFHRRASRPGHRVELDDLRSQRRHPPGRDAKHRSDALRRGSRRRRRVRRGCSSTSPSPRCATRSPS